MVKSDRSGQRRKPEKQEPSGMVAQKIMKICQRRIPADFAGFRV